MMTLYNVINVEELENVCWSGTHDLPLPTVLNLAERLKRLPPTVLIWSVEGSKADVLDPMSPEVAAAVPRIVDEITGEISQLKLHA